MRTSTLLCTLAILWPSLASAQTISVPPVQISTLSHLYVTQMGETYTSDYVLFPCSGGNCNGPGFTAAISQNDTMVIRFEAPAGSRFTLTRAPGGIEGFVASAYWRTGISDATSNNPSATFTFEHLVGTAPTNVSALNSVSDNGEEVTSMNQFVVNADCSFSALEVRFVVPQALPLASRIYGPVESHATPSFHCTRDSFGGEPDATLMVIEPEVVTGFCYPGQAGIISCPCANPPATAMSGCENRQTIGTGGAILIGWGNPSLAADTLSLGVVNTLNHLHVLFEGTRNNANTRYGAGVRCVTSGANGAGQSFLKRIKKGNASGGGIEFTGISAASASKGAPLVSGQTYYYYVAYRNAEMNGAPGCPGLSFGFNATNAAAAPWSP